MDSFNAQSSAYQPYIPQQPTPQVYQYARVEDFSRWAKFKQSVTRGLKRFYLRKTAKAIETPVISATPQVVNQKAVVMARGALALWAIALLIVVISLAPTIFYTLFPSTVDAVANQLGTTVDVERSGFGDAIYEEPVYVPPFDPALPQENTLIIPKVGFNSTIQEGEDWDKALETGVWRVNNSGSPDDREFPMIFAAHRFGYLKWTNQYRRENSFYNLPKLENGDTIEVVWGQRKYVYEIFEGYTDTKLRHMEGDIILFTCELMNSDRRIVRHARLVVPEGFSNGNSFESLITYSK